jgi:hypothetical protein
MEVIVVTESFEVTLVQEVSVSAVVVVAIAEDSREVVVVSEGMAEVKSELGKGLFK